MSYPEVDDTEINPRGIGVTDYESLVSCLMLNYSRAFPKRAATDPQDAIQALAAEAIILHGIVARFDEFLKDPPEGINREWVETGVRGFAVAMLNQLLIKIGALPVEQRKEPTCKTGN